MSYFNGASTTNFGANSPTGNFSPTIFSKSVLMFLRTAAVVEGITNNEYFGEIAEFGDTVRIIKEPTVATAAYVRGATLANTALVDDEIVLEIDQARSFAFAIDDIEKQLAHVSWESLATGAATYELKQEYDKNVLAVISKGCQKDNIVNADATIQGAGTDILAHVAAERTAVAITLGFGAGETDPLNLLGQLALKLDETDTMDENRYAVVTPRFMELISQVDSKLLSSDYNQGEGGLKNGLVMTGKLRGFSIYKTNNATKYTSDTTSDGDDLGTLGDIVIAGQMGAVATASSMNKVEKIRAESTFADIVRGLHVYGRKVLRPESLSCAYVLYA